MDGVTQEPEIKYETKGKKMKVKNADFKVANEEECRAKMMKNKKAKAYTFFVGKKRAWRYNCFLRSNFEGRQPEKRHRACSGVKEPPKHPYCTSTTMDGVTQEPEIKYETKGKKMKVKNADFKVANEEECRAKMMKNKKAKAYTFFVGKKRAWRYNCFLRSNFEGRQPEKRHRACSGIKDE